MAGGATIFGMMIWLLYIRFTIPILGVFYGTALIADAGPLAFVALVPLLWALRSGRPRRGAAAAFAFGVVYYGFLLDWLVVFGTIAWLPLVVSQALFAAGSRQ